MKTLIAALAATVAVTAVAAPAVAQPYGQGRYEQSRYDRDHYRDGRWGYSERAETARRRIDSGVRNGELNRREAYRLRSDVDDFARLEARYRRDGLTRWERADLDRRYDAIIVAIRRQAYDRDYGQGYGYRR